MKRQRPALKRYPTVESTSAAAAATLPLGSDTGGAFVISAIGALLASVTSAPASALALRTASILLDLEIRMQLVTSILLERRVHNRAIGSFANTLVVVAPGVVGSVRIAETIGALDSRPASDHRLAASEIRHVDLVVTLSVVKSPRKCMVLVHCAVTVTNLARCLPGIVLL